MITRYLRPLAAALLLMACAGAASAVSTPPNAFFTPRINSTQQVNYYRVVVNFNDANIGSAVQFGMLPKGASILNVRVEVVTVFNAGTTNVLTAGTTAANANELVNATDVNEAATGVTDVTRGQGTSLTAAADVGLWVKFTQTGTAATTGQAILVIAYVPNNDQ